MKVILTAAALSALMGGVASAAVDMNSVDYIMTANNEGDVRSQDTIYQPTDFDRDKVTKPVWC